MTTLELVTVIDLPDLSAILRSLSVGFDEPIDKPSTLTDAITSATNSIFRCVARSAP